MVRKFHKEYCNLFQHLNTKYDHKDYRHYHPMVYDVIFEDINTKTWCVALKLHTEFSKI